MATRALTHRHHLDHAYQNGIHCETVSLTFDKWAVRRVAPRRASLK